MRLTRRSLRDEEGSVLIAVVGIMVVLSVLAIGAYAMSSDNLLQSKRERARTQALSVAEAGLEEVLWRMKIGQEPTATAPFLVDVPQMGKCTIEASQTGSVWHVIATGSASSTPGITRTVSTYVSAISIWDMFFSDSSVNPGVNGKFNGQGHFYGSMYMRGDWPNCKGQPSFNWGPFFVKGGNIQLGGSADIGNNTPGGLDLFCDGLVDPRGIDPSTRIHTSVPDLKFPTQDTGNSRGDAISESIDCLQGPTLPGQPIPPNNDETRISGDSTGVPTPLSPPYTDQVYVPDPLKPVSRFYKVIDNDSVENSSVTAFYIGDSATGATLPSFGHPYDPKLGNSQDDFAWDANKHVLTVQGTVFIDAKDVYIENVKWAGKGTIVCSGNVHISKGLWEPACFSVDPVTSQGEDDPLGYPKKNCVGISASGYVEDLSPNSYGVFYSAQYFTVDQKMNAGSNIFHGEIVAPVIALNSHSDFYCTRGMGEAVPKSMPGGEGKIVSVSNWHEGRN